MKFPIYMLGLLLLVTSCNTSTTPDNNDKTTVAAVKKPKNVILLIGDGMGLSQVSVAQFELDEPPNFERFPVVGLIKTSSSAQLITDSAAGATAFASGVKTYNGAIGVNPDSTHVANLSELFNAANISSGVIATSTITHATPASFYAHAVSRNMHQDIATDLVNSNISYFAGGGLRYFKRRKDSTNILPDLAAKGFTIDTTQIPTTATEKMALILADNAMPTMLEGRGDFLTKASKLAIACLSKNPEGYFLMIEGSQIDWGGHDNDAAYLTTELLDFDATVGAVLDYAQQDGETLVIVTADHETGGFTLSSDGASYNVIEPSFSTGGHSATMVPVFAFGPGESEFGGIYENTQIFNKIMELMARD